MVFKTEDLGYRAASDEDVKNMTNLFTKLHFHVDPEQRDLSAEVSNNNGKVQQFYFPSFFLLWICVHFLWQILQLEWNGLSSALDHESLVFCSQHSIRYLTRRKKIFIYNKTKGMKRTMDVNSN